MKFRVSFKESMEVVVEATDMDKVTEWMLGATIREVNSLVPDGGEKPIVSYDEEAWEVSEDTPALLKLS